MEKIELGGIMEESKFTFKDKVETLISKTEFTDCLIREAESGVEVHYAYKVKPAAGMLYMISMNAKLSARLHKYFTAMKIYPYDNYVYLQEENSVFADMNDMEFQVWMKLN